MHQIALRQVDPDNQDFIRLCSELDLFLDIAIGGESKRAKYKKFNYLDTMDYVIVAYDKEEAVGCGALRKYSDTDVEVKRVFVRESFRGQNLGGRLLEQLISYAGEAGYKRLILETGSFLQASLALYSRYGFERIENYGAYKNMEESLCMGLNIEKGSIRYCRGRWISKEDLKELFESVNWMSARYADRLSAAFKKAGTVISAWEDNKLVGLIEVLDDGELTAYIHYLLVHPSFQKRKIGASLVKRVKEIYKDYLYLMVICENKNTVPFYEKLEFSKAEGTTALEIVNAFKNNKDIL